MVVQLLAGARNLSPLQSTQP